MEGELLRLGPLVLYSYGCALAAAFLAGTTLVVHEAAHKRYNINLVLELVVRVIVVGLLAGRLGYCLPDAWYYLTHPWEFLRIPQGGLSYLPAVCAGTAYIWWFTRKHGLHLWSILDVLAPGLAAGLIIGFLGAVEVQPTENAFLVGSLYWAPPTLAFFTLEYMGLWYLMASRRRLAPGRRFCQIMALDAAARILSSGWAWAIYGDALPHALSVVVGVMLLAAAVKFSTMLVRQADVPVAATGEGVRAEEAVKTAEQVGVAGAVAAATRAEVAQVRAFRSKLAGVLGSTLRRLIAIFAESAHGGAISAVGELGAGPVQGVAGGMSRERLHPRRRRLPVRDRIIRAGVWFGVYILFVILLGRTLT